MGDGKNLNDLIVTCCSTMLQFCPATSHCGQPYLMFQLSDSLHGVSLVTAPCPHTHVDTHVSEDVSSSVIIEIKLMIDSKMYVRISTDKSWYKYLFLMESSPVWYVYSKCVCVCVYLLEVAESGLGRKVWVALGEKSNLWPELLWFSASIPSTNLSADRKEWGQWGNKGEILTICKLKINLESRRGNIVMRYHFQMSDQTRVGTPPCMQPPRTNKSLGTKGKCSLD